MLHGNIAGTCLHDLWNGLTLLAVSCHLANLSAISTIYVCLDGRLFSAVAAHC